MKKDKPIKINIPSPCSQDWNAMPLDKGGRYCNQCTQVIHDFSQMPDAELLQYFKTYPETTCGRFHKQQLNRELHPQKIRWSLPDYGRKIAATFLAALSFRTTTAQIAKKVNPPVAVQPTITEKDTIPESIVISGKVTRGNSEPVANAKVSVDTLITVLTDTEGKFTIPLSGNLLTTHNLYFSYDGLERTVRTFHPLMGSTSYDVRLVSKEDYNYYGYIAGGISFNTIEFPSIRFPNRQRYLSGDAKAILNVIAEKLRDNPNIMIKVVAYGSSNNDTKNAKRKLRLILDFLIKDIGIDKERVAQSIEAAGANDTIDILQYLGE